MPSIQRNARAFISLLVVISGVALFPACSKKSDDASKQPLTQAQRDSAIAASKLPGAGVVGKALEVADSAETRANEPIAEP